MITMCPNCRSYPLTGREDGTSYCERCNTLRVDMTPFVEYIEELQAETERIMHRRFSQLASDGYDPYNKQHAGRRYVYRVLPDVVGSPAPDHSPHAMRKS